jgi:hypothetical protein
MTSMKIQKNASSLITTIYAQIILQSWSGILVAQDKFTWTLPSYEISVPPFTSAKVFGVTWKEVVELPYHPTQSNQFASSDIRKLHTSIQYSFCLWIKWFSISSRQLSTLQTTCSLLTRKFVKLL